VAESRLALIDLSKAKFSDFEEESEAYLMAERSGQAADAAEPD